jgi:hypothetical protein
MHHREATYVPAMISRFVGNFLNPPGGAIAESSDVVREKPLLWTTMTLRKVNFAGKRQIQKKRK